MVDIVSIFFPIAQRGKNYEPGKRTAYSTGKKRAEGLRWPYGSLWKIHRCHQLYRNDWKKGAVVEAALLAPTAMNQQKFTFALSGNRVSVKAGIGFYTKIDLGIVKYHFEAGAGTEHFVWA